MRHGPYAVIEGQDGTGKTVLADHLVEKHGFTYVHRGPPEKDVAHYYLDGLREHEGPVVSDRLHAGSWVYGMVFRGGPDMTDYEEWAFEGYLLARGALMVHCSVEPEVIEKNLARGPDGEDAKIYEAPEKREKLRELYDVYMKRSRLSIMRYDFTIGNMVQVGQAIENILRSNEEERPRFDAGMIGNSIAPRLVLVGEQPHGRVRVAQRFRKRGSEAVRRAMRMVGRGRDRGGALSEGPAGRYLYQTLRAAKVGIRDVCILNAIQWDGRTVSDLVGEDPQWWGRVILGEGAEVIALGNVAAEQLERARIPHRKVPHPQYVRRFFYKRLADYGRMIAGVLPYVEKEWRHG